MSKQLRMKDYETVRNLCGFYSPCRCILIWPLQIFIPVLQAFLISELNKIDDTIS